LPQSVFLPPPPSEVHGSTTPPGRAWGTQMSLLELTVEEIKMPSEMEVAPHYRLLSLMVTLFTWFDTVDLVDTVETAE